MKIYIYIFCLLFSVFNTRAADFDLVAHGTLSMTVPDDWSINGKAVSRPDGTPIGYALVINPRSDANAKCLLTFAYKTNGAPNQEVIRKEVLRITEQFVSESVEKKQNLKDFSLEQGCGSYCLFTDALLVGEQQVPPGNYKVMGSGEVQPADNVVGVVTLFADEPDGMMKVMIKIINSLKIEPSSAK